VAGGGAVVAHTDCTARKRAEAEAVRHRTEAAHAARAATLGELAAGLAHELNQPLGAILTNVQAARRLVRLVPPQTDLLSEILDDVAADDLRASEIIRRMRALLRKGELDFQPVDVNEITHDVLRLVASDAILRQVRVMPQFEPDLPGVVGDRVQLQQVILNLVVNAMEAMASVPMERRRLVVRTSHPKPMLIQVAVQDQGPGFSPDVLRRMYDPFFSTKPDGLGMGLSISRSIIDAHGGRVRAFNNPAGGAIVSFTLPVYLADEGAPRRIVNAGPAKEQTPDGVPADSLRR
jgi:two-component system sensor kinase FixL